MKYWLVMMLLLAGCSETAITPQHIKMAVEACKDRSTWKSVAREGDKLWVVCADDVPMSLHLSHDAHGDKEHDSKKAEH